MSKTGVLLINLGTPDHCDRRSVYRYLTEFLNDKRVIDLPAVARFVLTNLLIVPFRSRASAEAYKQIWTEAGSPLLVHTLALTKAVQEQLGDDYQVECAMRYGKPSIETAIKNLSLCENITILPLFPQYSSAATGSALEKTLSLISQQWNVPSIKVINDFYDHPGFINPYADLIRRELADKPVDIVLFSYHGLPERHIDKSACHAACDRMHACPLMNDANAFCYRAQCYQTSIKLAEAAGLAADKYRVSFQSRLGRTPWIKPYTDTLLPELIKQGHKKIAVACPSFVSDCLETLEEVNMRLREQWLALGGEAFHFIPCLNSDAGWVLGVSQIIST